MQRSQAALLVYITTQCLQQELLKEKYRNYMGSKKEGPRIPLSYSFAFLSLAFFYLISDYLFSVQ